MNNLEQLKKDLELLTKFHQIEILKILSNSNDCIINENKNGVFINLTSLNDNLIHKLSDYLSYVSKQEKQLNDVEDKKKNLTDIYFKGIKDNNLNKTNTEIQSQYDC